KARTAKGAASFNDAYSGRIRRTTTPAMTSAPAVASVAPSEKRSARGDSASSRRMKPASKHARGGTASTKEWGDAAATNGNTPTTPAAHVKSSSDLGSTNGSRLQRLPSMVKEAIAKKLHGDNAPAGNSR